MRPKDGPGLEHAGVLDKAIECNAEPRQPDEDFVSFLILIEIE